jgi:hypothetical protein
MPRSSAWRWVALFTLILVSAAEAANAVDAQLEIILNDPDTRAKDRAGVALAKIGQPALAPLLAKVREMDDRKHPPPKWASPEYFARPLKQVGDAVGPAGKKFIVEAFLDERDLRGRSALWGAVEPLLAMRTAFECAAAGKPLSEDVADTFVRHVNQLTVQGRDEKEIGPYLTLFQKYSAVVQKHPGLTAARKTLEVSGVPVKARTFVVGSGKVTDITVTELEDFFLELPLPRGMSAWEWDLGEPCKDPLDCNGPRHMDGPIRELGVTETKTKYLLRFFAEKPATTQMTLELPGRAFDAPLTRKVRLVIKPLEDAARAEREGQLQKSPDPALRTPPPPRKR